MKFKKLTTHIFTGTFIATLYCTCSYGQTLKEKTEKLFLPRNKLFEQTTEYYNNNGKIVRSVTNSLEQDPSLTVTNFFYNEQGFLIKETFSGSRSFIDSTGIRQWTDTCKISERIYLYDGDGRIRLEKIYNFECRFDTCNIIEYYYTGNLLTRKFHKNFCSNKSYYYPVYYKYNHNDSLILEQAFGPIDTTRVWYQYSYNYDSFPGKFIWERYYRTGDSLFLESRSVTKTDYDKGKKIKTTYLDSYGKYDTFEYNKKGLLKCLTTIHANEPFRKLVYAYDKQNNVILIETFKKQKNKLELNNYKKYTYVYY